MIPHFRFLQAATLAALSIALSGCGDSVVPTAPSSPLVYADVAPASTSHFIAKGQVVKRTRTIDSEIVVTKTITPKGGYIYVRKAGLYLLFPEGAVAQNLEVSVVAHAGNRLVYSFEPHGTTFLKPIYFLQELRYTELNTPRSERNRPDVWGGYLERGPDDVGTDGYGSFTEVFDGFYHGKGNDALAYFTTTHFSGYAMASGRRESSGQ